MSWSIKVWLNNQEPLWIQVQYAEGGTSLGWWWAWSYSLFSFWSTLSPISHTASLFLLFYHHFFSIFTLFCTSSFFTFTLVPTYFLISHSLSSFLFPHLPFFFFVPFTSFLVLVPSLCHESRMNLITVKQTSVGKHFVFIITLCIDWFLKSILCSSSY